jgi:tetratricopeptide (TPR) repeat protein
LATAIDENYIDAYYERSIARFARQKYEDAIKDCDRVIKRDPNYAQAYENKGNAFLALKKKVEAKQAFEQAAKIYFQKQENTSLQRVQQIIAGIAVAK